jgi:hypothetical protein
MSVFVTVATIEQPTTPAQSTTRGAQVAFANVAPIIAKVAQEIVGFEEFCALTLLFVAANVAR